jgi:hypothetical protein
MKIRTPIRPLVPVERHKTYYPHLLIVAVLWMVTMTFDYYDQKLVAEAQAAKHEADFTECLKGKWRVETEDGEWGCLPVQLNRKDKK